MGHAWVTDQFPLGSADLPGVYHGSAMRAKHRVPKLTRKCIRLWYILTMYIISVLLTGVGFTLPAMSHLWSTHSFIADPWVPEGSPICHPGIYRVDAWFHRSHMSPPLVPYSLLVPVHEPPVGHRWVTHGFIALKDSWVSHEPPNTGIPWAVHRPRARHLWRSLG